MIITLQNLAVSLVSGLACSGTRPLVAAKPLLKNLKGTARGQGDLAVLSGFFLADMGPSLDRLIKGEVLHAAERGALALLGLDLSEALIGLEGVQSPIFPNEAVVVRFFKKIGIDSTGGTVSSLVRWSPRDAKTILRRITGPDFDSYRDCLKESDLYRRGVRGPGAMVIGSLIQALDTFPNKTLTPEEEVGALVAEIKKMVSEGLVSDEQKALEKVYSYKRPSRHNAMGRFFERARGSDEALPLPTSVKKRLGKKAFYKSATASPAARAMPFSTYFIGTERGGFWLRFTGILGLASQDLVPLSRVEIPDYIAFRKSEALPDSYCNFSTYFDDGTKGGGQPRRQTPHYKSFAKTYGALNKVLGGYFRGVSSRGVHPAVQRLLFEAWRRMASLDESLEKRLSA